MSEKKSYVGRFTQNYPTERRDYPGTVNRDAGLDNVSFERGYDIRMKVLPLKQADPEIEWGTEEPELPPGFDGTPKAA